jgi:hypothetical protein
LKVKGLCRKVVLDKCYSRIRRDSGAPALLQHDEAVVQTSLLVPIYNNYTILNVYKSLAMVFEDNGTPCMALDKIGTVHYVNKKWQTLFNWPYSTPYNSTEEGMMFLASVCIMIEIIRGKINLQL